MADRNPGAPGGEPSAPPFFYRLYGRPWLLVIASVALMLGVVPFFSNLHRDSRPDSNLDPDDPVVLFRDKVTETFGLADPLIVAVVRDGPGGVFTPHALGLVDWLTEEIRGIPGVDPDRVTSLATERDIVGTDEALLVDPFFETPPRTQAEADRVRDAVMDLELYLGRLVARDGTATLIVAELLDEDLGELVYQASREVVARAPAEDEEIHIAGYGAASAHLGEYIDADSRRLNPISFVLISLVLLAAYRSVRGLMLPNLAVIGTLLLTVGTLCLFRLPFYTIMSGLTVILIGISVADGVHILGEYYQQVAAHPDAPSRTLVARTMGEMWRPVATTSVTSAAGFLSLGLTSYGPPMRTFGIFAAVGVTAALLFSVITLPAVLVLLKPRTSAAYARRVGRVDADWLGRASAVVGGWIVRRPIPVLVAAFAFVVVGVTGALRLEVDDHIISYFDPSEPIYQADAAINQRLDGTTFYDVMIETAAPGALYEPANLRRIEALQERLEAMPEVGGTISLVDYVKQMNRALNGDAPEAYAIPDDPDLVAQYVLLYTAASDPDALEEFVDYDFRLANVRVISDRGRHTDRVAVGEATERYIREEFNAPGIQASLSGRAKLSSHWLEVLWAYHYRGVTLAFVVVFLTAAVAFRSFAAALLAMVSVSLALVFTYGVMGFLGIWFRVGTSMLAPIAIGLSVDFSVHTIDRLIELRRHRGLPLAEAFAGLFPATGRALVFNFLALLFGFGVLATLASTEQIRNFGLLVCVCLMASFIASFTLIPALVRLIQPRFLEPAASRAAAEPAPQQTGLPADLGRHAKSSRR